MLPSKKKPKHTRTASLEALSSQIQQRAKATRNNLTQDQIEKLNQFIRMLEEEGLTPKERTFCDEACLCRYLRARDWNVEKAYKMLRGTLKWREDFKVEAITADSLKDEAKTGKLFRRKTDNSGRPIVYMTPARENSKNYEKNIQLLVYTMERATEAMSDNIEQIVLIVDFSGYSLTNAPPFNVSMESLNILSNHYPERLGVAFMVDTPWIFGMFWKAISAFVHPNTQQKIQFVNGDSDKTKVFSKLFDMTTIEKRFAGSSDFKWDDTIWKAEIEADLKRIKKFNITPIEQQVALEEKKPAPAHDTQQNEICSDDLA